MHTLFQNIFLFWAINITGRARISIVSALFQLFYPQICRKNHFFIGKPPKKFGIAWIDDQGEIVNFKSLVEERGLSPVSLGILSDKLKEVYIRHQQEPRYSKTILDKKVVVTPSETLRDDVMKVVKETLG